MIGVVVPAHNEECCIGAAVADRGDDEARGAGAEEGDGAGEAHGLLQQAVLGGAGGGGEAPGEEVGEEQAVRGHVVSRGHEGRAGVSAARSGR